MMGRKMPLPSETTVTVTVVQEGMPDIKLQCPGMFRSFIWKNNLPDRRATVGNRFLICVLVGGTNIRELLVDNGINVYRSVTRWTNCKGKQRCGTCIVDVSHLTTHFKQLNCDPFLWTCLLQQQCSLPLIRHFPSLITIFDHHLWSPSLIHVFTSGIEESWSVYSKIFEWKFCTIRKSRILPAVVHHKCVWGRYTWSPRSGRWSCIRKNSKSLIVVIEFVVWVTVIGSGTGVHFITDVAWCNISDMVN